MKCAECRGACCETFKLPLDWAIDDYSKWFAFHGKRGPDGLTEFECRCTKLTKEGRCDIYSRRPEVCRTFLAGSVECLETVRRRRTPEEFARIREEGDPDH